MDSLPASVQSSPGKMTTRLLLFMDALRGVGFQIGVREAKDVMALATSDLIFSKSGFQHSLKTLLCSNAYEWQRFDRHFLAYFAMNDDTPSDGSGEDNKGVQKKNPDDMKFQIVADFYHGEDDINEGGAGRNGAVTNTDFRFLTDPEGWEDAARLTEQLARKIKARPSRRWRKTRSGKRIDLATTGRHLMATDGDPLRIGKKTRRHRPMHVVALLDVSHSMSYYSPMLARFVRGLLHNFENSEAFCFHIELNRITDLLLEADMAVMREKMESFSNLWFGGTNISASLTAFNKQYLRDVVTRNSVVLLISDGCDISEPDELLEPMRELRATGRKLFWINPMQERLERAGLVSSSPLMGSESYIDEFVSGDSLQSLERLARLLS